MRGRDAKASLFLFSAWFSVLRNILKNYIANGNFQNILATFYFALSY